jgi:hypothetical protein
LIQNAGPRTVSAGVRKPTIRSRIPSRDTKSPIRSKIPRIDAKFQRVVDGKAEACTFGEALRDALEKHNRRQLLLRDQQDTEALLVRILEVLERLVNEVDGVLAGSLPASRLKRNKLVGTIEQVVRRWKRLKRAQMSTVNQLDFISGTCEMLAYRLLDFINDIEPNFDPEIFKDEEEYVETSIEWIGGEWR